MDHISYVLVFDSEVIDNNYFGFLYQTDIVEKQLMIIQQGSSRHQYKC